MLSFIGVGNAFNYDDGNCSAFYKDNNKMLLIDCGENIFEKILQYNLLDGIDNLNILITHFHSDHIGSLGSLLFYADKINIKNVVVAYPNLVKLNELINLFGVQECKITLTTPEQLSDFKIKSIKQEHAIIEAYGYLINIMKNIIYYSGDTKIIPVEILEMFNNSNINYFYQDVSMNINRYHISINELEKLIPFDKRKNINCMHIESEFGKSQVCEKGFSLVKKYRNGE